MSEVRMSEVERWLNNSQFAAAEGCDEKQVRRGLARGTLVARDDGKLDASQVRSGWRKPRVDSREAEIGHVPLASNVRTGVRAQPSDTPVKLRRGEVVKQLLALDWTQGFDWSDRAIRARVVSAAIAVGLEAVESPQKDDGHWGGWQLRNPVLQSRQRGLCFDAVVCGFGFELGEEEVLTECRFRLYHEAETQREMDEMVTVRIDLLHLLAYPFGPTHRPPEQLAGNATKVTS